MTFPKSLARVSQLPLVIWSSSVGEGHRSNIEKCTPSTVKIGRKVDTDLILTNTRRVSVQTKRLGFIFIAFLLVL